ncbi:MAG: diguanylate cyclase [Chloroflexaceae bacterium]|nr:diguanylate cyclase [Chloroflexaceae bacterium]
MTLQRVLTPSIRNELFERDTSAAQGPPENLEIYKLLARAVAHITDAVLITEADLNYPGPRVVFINAAFEQLTGYTFEEIQRLSLRILQGPLTDQGILFQLRQALERGEEFTGQVITYRRDGTPYHVEWHSVPIRNQHHVITHFISVQRNISEQIYQTLLERDQREVMERLVESEPLDNILSSIVQMLEHQRPAMHATVQVLHRRRVVHRVAANIAPEYLEFLDTSCNALYQENQPPSTPCTAALALNTLMIVPDNTEPVQWKQWQAMALRSGIHSCWIIPVNIGNDVTMATVALYGPVAACPTTSDYRLLELAGHLLRLALERRYLHDQLREHELRDRLTKLPNRNAMLEHLERMIPGELSGLLTTVMVFDLDRFHEINSTIGYRKGDQLLKLIPQRLWQHLPAEAMLARLGSDEFGLILPHQRNVQDAVRLARRLIDALNEVFTVDDIRVFLSASAGISFAPHG